MSKLDKYLQWTIETCNTDNVGYSNLYRQGQTVDGITYYDCSSFVSTALTVGGYFSENPWFTTYNMVDMLLNLGFTEYNPNTEPWKQGDIMYTTEHTEIVYNAENYYCMGAHTDRYPLAEQVSISNLSTKNYWERAFRPPSESSYKWYAKPTYGYNEQSIEETNNAMMIYNILSAEGWTVEAIAGAVGNMRHESGLNPWRWEWDVISYPDNTPPWDIVGDNKHGYGLVQYTPNGKYILNPNAQSLQGFSPNYRGHTGTPEDGTAQILFTSRYGDWYNREWAPSEYRMDYEEYKHSTQSPEILARVWLWCYEYPADIESQYTIRSNSAKYFYELFKGEPPTPPEPQPTPPYIRKSRFKIMYYLKNHKII